jgi:hypothetical protein
MDELTYMMFLCHYDCVHHEQQKNNEIIDATHRRRRQPFRAHLCGEGQRRRDQRIPRASLPMPWNTPWEMIYGSANDQALITLTGFDSASFNRLHGHSTNFLIGLLHTWVTMVN